MSDLLKAEFLRLASRRLAWGLLIVVVAMAALVSLTTSEAIRPVDRNDPAIVSAYEQTHDSYEQAIKDCGQPDNCGIVEPRIEDFLRPAWNYAQYVESSVVSVGIIMLVAAAALGASMIGAEYVSGSMATQLTFTPMRLRVMAAKLIAATTGALGIALAFITASVVVSTITFLTLRGASEVHAGVALPAQLGRFLVLAVLISALAAALTLALGSSFLTGGVLTVVMIGSLVVTPFITRPTPLLELLPSSLVGALLMGELTVWSHGADSVALATITYPWALTFSVVAVALVISVSALVFRRKDILR